MLNMVVPSGYLKYIDMYIAMGKSIINGVFHGKSSVNGSCSIAMLDNQRVN